MKRIYVVTHGATGEKKLVRGTSRATARSAAVRDAYTVELASQDDLVKLVSLGVKVLEEGAPEEQLEWRV